jgi:hypothetical protein
LSTPHAQAVEESPRTGHQQCIRVVLVGQACVPRLLLHAVLRGGANATLASMCNIWAQVWLGCLFILSLPPSLRGVWRAYASPGHPGGQAVLFPGACCPLGPPLGPPRIKECTAQCRANPPVDFALGQRRRSPGQPGSFVNSVRPRLCGWCDPFSLVRFSPDPAPEVTWSTGVLQTGIVYEQAMGIRCLHTHEVCRNLSQRP